MYPERFASRRLSFASATSEGGHTLLDFGDRVRGVLVAVFTRQRELALQRRSDPAASGEFVAAHVRRLKALPRAGVGERSAEGVWTVPANYLEAARTFDQKLGRETLVKVEILSPAPLEKLTTADAATWLDSQLIGTRLPTFAMQDLGGQ